MEKEEKRQMSKVGGKIEGNKREAGEEGWDNARKQWSRASINHSSHEEVPEEEVRRHCFGKVRI